MVSDQEIRAQAAQAAASVAVQVGLGDATGFIQVASMIETYISSGAEAAQKVVDSWSAPAPAPASAAPEASPQDTRVAPNGDSPTDTRAQELADEAYRATSRVQLKQVIDRVKAGGLEDSKVTVDNAQVALKEYLNARWAALPAPDNTNVPLNERNKSTREQAIASMRSDLGL